MPSWRERLDELKAHLLDVILIRWSQRDSLERALEAFDASCNPDDAEIAATCAKLGSVGQLQTGPVCITQYILYTRYIYFKLIWARARAEPTVSAGSCLARARAHVRYNFYVCERVYMYRFMYRIDVCMYVCMYVSSKRL